MQWTEEQPDLRVLALPEEYYCPQVQWYASEGSKGSKGSRYASRHHVPHQSDLTPLLRIRVRSPRIAPRPP